MKDIKTLTLFILLSVTLQTTALAKTYTLELVQSWQQDSLFSEVVNRFVENAETLSNQRITINVTTQEKLNQSDVIFDLVQQGNYAIGHTDSSFWRKKDRNTLFFSSTPFGMITPEMYAWFYHGGGIDLMKKVYAKHGLLSFPGGNTGSQMAGWFRREVRCVQSIKGIRMRMTGLGGEVMRNIGVNIVDVPTNQLYEQLDTGELDAVSMAGPAVDFTFGFYKVAPFYYTGWNAPSAEMQFLLNEKIFNELPEALQNILVTSMRLAAYELYTKVQHENGVKLALIKQDFPHIKFRAFPSDVIRILHHEASRLIQDIIDQGDDLTKEITDSMKQYSQDMRAWTRVGDQAYLNNSGI